ncbi:AraC family ligand binding domain-containing protein [Variovorax sp. J22R133]|uniref:AraC family ligand binding domain-containing protein n=1 Tax=Variovorax brevis TaxID=3053503 RepID=UPI00257749FF|nr:AraC family ligand binding domain-containing protein [Variovorax sp. J22R133]MDM0112738.1 AraC family ligand binding domain-containing protein [Variovorax sp. J22R133]
MTTTTFEEYEAAMQAKGFPEVLVRDGAADTVVPNHSHPFAVEALVVRGEMWLTVGDDTRHLVPGDTFKLDHQMPHAERYGSSGATYWAARRTEPWGATKGPHSRNTAEPALPGRWCCPRQGVGGYTK